MKAKELSWEESKFNFSLLNLVNADKHLQEADLAFKLKNPDAWYYALRSAYRRLYALLQKPHREGTVVITRETLNEGFLRVRKLLFSSKHHKKGRSRGSMIAKAKALKELDELHMRLFQLVDANKLLMIKERKFSSDVPALVQSSIERGY